MTTYDIEYGHSSVEEAKTLADALDSFEDSLMTAQASLGGLFGMVSVKVKGPDGIWKDVDVLVCEDCSAVGTIEEGWVNHEDSGVIYCPECNAQWDSEEWKDLFNDYESLRMQMQWPEMDLDAFKQSKLGQRIHALAETSTMSCAMCSLRFAERKCPNDGRNEECSLLDWLWLYLQEEYNDHEKAMQVYADIKEAGL
jgi:hypothetical protein